MKTPRIITTTFGALMIGTALSLSSAFGDTVEKKAEKTVIPKLEFKDASVSDLFKAITTSTGIKVFYVPTKGNDVRITISLKNVPAAEALIYVTELANLKFTYEKDGVHVTAR